MPLNRTCSLDAVSDNIRREMEAGKSQAQAIAISLSVLKRSCGVDSKERMTPKEIVQAGRGKAEAAQIFRAQAVKDKNKSYLHTKIKGRLGKAGDAVMNPIYKHAPKGLKRALRGEAVHTPLYPQRKECSCASEGLPGAFEAKLPTYAKAKEAIFQALGQAGWKVASNLKVPHATSSDGNTRLWFKTQAVYHSHSPTGAARDIGGAHSMWLDLRTVDGPTFLKHVEKWNQIKSKKEENTMQAGRLSLEGPAGRLSFLAHYRRGLQEASGPANRGLSSKMQAGKYYQHTLASLSHLYFHATAEQKNGAMKGVSYDDSSRKAAKTQVQRLDQGQWQEVSADDVPAKGLDKIKAKLEHVDLFRERIPLIEQRLFGARLDESGEEYAGVRDAVSRIQTQTKAVINSSDKDMKRNLKLLLQWSKALQTEVQDAIEAYDTE